MRIDLPCCGFHACRFQFDGNCTNKQKYVVCEYQKMSNVLHAIIGSQKLCVMCANTQCKDATTQSRNCIPVWNGGAM